MELFGIKLLELTSLLFFTNFFHNTWHKEYPYAWLMLLLTISSFLIHSDIFITKHESLEFYNKLILLERFIILSIIIYGGYLFWKTNLFIKTSFIPISTFLSIVYMYCVGYFQNIYSFDSNIDKANLSHGAIHILGCLGHHMVMYEYGKLHTMDT